MNITPADFGASFKGFMEQMSAAVPGDEPILRRRIKGHLGCEPNELRSVSSPRLFHTILGISVCAWAVACSVILVAAEPAVMTRCAAISLDNDSRMKSVPDGPRPVVVIAVGTVRMAPGGKQEQILQVERTLFGPHFESIPLAEMKESLAEGRQIYCLSYPRKANGFRLSVSEFFERERVFPLEEEPAVAAMAQARLDMLLIGSDAIFVGRPVNTSAKPKSKQNDTDDASGWRGPPNSVRVERLLSEAGPEPGTTVTVHMRRAPLPPSETYVYFADTERNRKGEDTYTASASWPASEAMRVAQGLERRSLFPVREDVDESGRVSRWREIVFTGTRQEAITMLGSQYDAAQLLAARRLISDGAAAIPEVVAAVEANLFRTRLDALDAFGQQQRMIDVLAILEERRPDGEVVRLIDRMLSEVQKGAAFPFDDLKPKDETTHRSRRYGLDPNVNHSLAWLLLALPEHEAARLFGARVLKLRDLAAYGWKDEMAHVVDNGHIEDHLELAVLADRTEDLKPISWQAGFRSDHLSNYTTALSADGKHFSAVGYGVGRVWSTKDWSLAGEFPYYGSAEEAMFSPDGRFLYVGGGALVSVFEKLDWTTGKIVRRYEGHETAVTALALSADGKYLLSSEDGYDHSTTIFSDAETGEILDRDDTSGWNRLVWHPDETWFLARGTKNQWFRVDWPRKVSTPLEFELIDAKFSLDGKTVYCLEGKKPAHRFSDNDFFGDPTSDEKKIPEKQHLRRRNAADFNIQAERTIDNPAEWLHVTDDGKQLVVCAVKQIEVVSASTLKTSVQAPLQNSIGNKNRYLDHPPVVSPDGTWIAYSWSYKPPEVYELKTGRRLPLGKAHSDNIVGSTFVNKDAHLKTEGDDGVVCVWNAADGSLIERTGDPVTPLERRSRRDRKTNHVSEDGTLEYVFEEGSRDFRYGPPTSYVIEVGPPLKSDEDEDAAKVPRRRPNRRFDDTAPRREGARELGKVELKWGQFEPLGLVPDGGHLFVATHVFRRDNLELVSAVNVSGEVEQVSYSSDGSRYAVVTSNRFARATMLAGVTQMVLEMHRVRVHETESGRTLLSVELPAPGVGCVALATKGNRIAIIGNDSSIQIWAVPDAADRAPGSR